MEFYVICVVIAASVLGLCLRPSAKSEARQYLLGSQLYESEEEDQTPRIEIRVEPDYSVTLIRRGLIGLCSDGAVSLAVEVAGFDISIKERVVAGRMTAIPADTARFSFDFLAPELYHLRYSTDFNGEEMASTPLRVRPGITIVKALKK